MCDPKEYRILCVTHDTILYVVDNGTTSRLCLWFTARQTMLIILVDVHLHYTGPAAPLCHQTNFIIMYLDRIPFSFNDFSLSGVLSIAKNLLSSDFLFLYHHWCIVSSWLIPNVFL